MTDLYKQDNKIVNNIKFAIVYCIQKGKKIDPRLYNMPITITDISFTKKSNTVRCYFMGFNTKFSDDELLEALNNSKNQIRFTVSKLLKTKTFPSIIFIHDNRFQNLFKISSVLSKLEANS
ncbi:ribosome-binding factor A [Rickettsia endosymbiont of Cardiosporidium cionae]|uniref:ribosome-binding factor A n=1 Tax=Rickettsia endosymbiont of Cardiosporidium cionae TaxID=2777155 RepID=UPI001893FAFB|nr:ribosome-binding factor A [Rickettsia endosymbiont of Cardiosporidium cionae]KAF8818911.1 ribosome-binding factor A [Rickettsia endosymbiont of Cardiosporidium cionae]